MLFKRNHYDSAAAKMGDKKFNGSRKNVLGFFLAFSALHFYASFNYWYWTYRWIDIPMHFLGGFWIGMVFFVLILPHLRISSGKQWIYFILALSFAALVGVLWEFFEFTYDIFLSQKTSVFFVNNGFAQQGVADTMKDLFMDLLGGAAFAAFYLNKKNKELSYSREKR